VVESLNLNTSHKTSCCFALFVYLCNYINMDANDTQQMADLLKALGEFNRLSLVYELCDAHHPQNAMCLCKCCQVDSSVVSRHLKILLDEGIVGVHKNGRERAYYLNRPNLAKTLRAFADKVEGKDEIIPPTKEAING